jgi:ribonucleoside-diphosphate reductase beta chain
MPLTESRISYKPFEYPWAYDAWKTQQSIHWLPDEVPMGEDVRDWTTKLNASEKNLVTQILRFFTQGDIMVNDAYLDHYLPVFKPPEIRMMMTAFASTETIHIAAYSHLIDTLGLPESEYSAFLDYQEMREKHDWFKTLGGTKPDEIAATIAAFSAGMEGTQLFASFAILMNFSRFNKLKGVGQIVAWSSRDEHLHAMSMIKLFNTYVTEQGINKKFLRARIDNVMQTVIDLEDKFIDKVFEMGGVEGLTSDAVKSYIRYIGNMRLGQMGFEPLWPVKVNPLPWMDDILTLPEHANFFEQRVTEYAKGSLVGNWNNAF